MDTRNLFIALIFLTCLLLILVTGYIANHHWRRTRKPQGDVENDAPTDQQTRPDVLREYYSEEQRLSHLTTVAPSIELLPEIRTSTGSDRADDWLERRDSRIMGGDLGLKTYKVSGILEEKERMWGSLKGKPDVVASSDGEEKSKTEVESLQDKVVLRKE